MNAPFLTQAADGLPRRGFTNAEIRRLVDVGVIDADERFELIKGEVVPMAPELSKHVRARMILTRTFMRALGDEWLIATDASLFLAPDTEFRPDLHIYPARLDSEDARGPDVLIAVEIAHTSQRKDLELKAPIYGAHGVRELWVLDLDANRAHIFRAPGAAGFDFHEELAADAPLAAMAFPDVSVRLADLI